MLKNHNWLKVTLAGGLLAVAALNWWIFKYKFNPVYWENYYYTSQWNVPNSLRQISDEGVYRYIGYRLVNGENPFNVDYWVPPLGKYIYGAFGKYAGNPYWASFGFYLGLVAGEFLLAKLVFKDKAMAYWSAILLAFNPLVVSQVDQTMLDLPLAVFLTFSLMFLVRYRQTNKSFMLLSSGLFLGLMAGTKPPFFSLVVLGVTVVWLAVVKKNIKIPAGYLVSVGAGYLAAYFCYFSRHPNPIPFVRLHQKVIEFQSHQGSQDNPLNLLRSVFLWSTVHYDGLVFQFTEWSLVLITGLAASGVILWRQWKRKKLSSPLFYLAMISVLYMASCSLVDFWPRYWVPIIPVLVVLTVQLLRKNLYLLAIIGLSYVPLAMTVYITSPSGVLGVLEDYFRRNQYQEIVELSVKPEAIDLSYLESGQENKVKLVESTKYSPWLRTAREKYMVNDRPVVVDLVKEDNQWRIGAIEVE